MNKPDWGSAPDWANWLAQDSNGSWWWYENEPTKVINGIYEQSGGRMTDAKMAMHGHKEPRPKPKVRTITVGKGKVWIPGEVFGPCTITITEGVGQSNVKQ